MNSCSEICMNMICCNCFQTPNKEYDKLINEEPLPTHIEELSCSQTRNRWLLLPKNYGTSGLFYRDCGYSFGRPCYAWIPTAICTALAMATLFTGIRYAVNPNSWDNLTIGAIAIDYAYATLLGLFSALIAIPCASSVYYSCTSKTNKNCCASWLTPRNVASASCASISLIFSLALLYSAINLTVDSSSYEKPSHIFSRVGGMIGCFISAIGCASISFCCFGYHVKPQCARTYRRMKSDIRVGTRYVDGSALCDRLFNYTCLVDPTCSSCYPTCLLPPKKEDPKIIEV